MESRTIQFIADVANGRLASGDTEKSVTCICTDSRKLQAGNVFLALRGESFDGHAFVQQVCDLGAAAVVLEEGAAPGMPGDTAVIEVADTRIAYGVIAAAYRSQFKLPVVAIAGSNGKTTTKELLASILREAGPTLWSEASFNNDVGVPATLLRLESAHQALVQEIGTNHPGELKPLIEVVRPNYGVITSIGREHLEHFGDLEGVVEEESKLAELLPPNGALFLSGDSDYSETIASRCPSKTILAGASERCDWRVSDVRVEPMATHFKLDCPVVAWTGDYHVPMPGAHHAINAALALAVAQELGASNEQARVGLETVTPPAMRAHYWEVNGYGVLEDCYNANPDSMSAAIETLQSLPCQGRRFAVLGDMAELGSGGDDAHREAGRRAAECGIDILFAVGSMAYCYAGGARSAGATVISEYDNAADAGNALLRAMRPGDLVLIKASRSARLERISTMIRGQTGDNQAHNHEQSAKTQTLA
ncbi:MAG: hypothetical protein CMO80_09040 [Verrucomicrobiales bacterium]|nr:hypothetical protein [Verrucomicrobiales bacterium]